MFDTHAIIRLIPSAALTVAVLLALGAASHGEQVGPRRRVLAADYSPGKKRIAILDADGKIQWQHPINNIHDAHVLPNGNVLFQADWTKIVEADKEGKVVWQYDARTNGNENRAVEVHAFQRLEDGTTMIAESGPGRIIEVDRHGRITKQIKLMVSKPDAHRDTRNARKLPNGNYLVAHEGDAAVREYDATGNVVWEYPVGSAVYSSVRLGNGNTLIGTGNGHSVIEVSPEKKIVWQVGENDVPGLKLAWVTQVARLANGNTIIVNCHAGPDQPQIVEITPDRKVVWSFKDFEHFGNALPVAEVLDIEGRTAR